MPISRHSMGAAAPATIAPTSYSTTVQLMKATPPMSATMAGAMVAATRVSAACSQIPMQSTMKRLSSPDAYRSRQVSPASAAIIYTLPAS